MTPARLEDSYRNGNGRRPARVGGNNVRAFRGFIVCVLYSFALGVAFVALFCR